MKSLSLIRIRFLKKNLLIVLSLLVFNFSYSQGAEPNWQNSFRNCYYQSFRWFIPLKEYWIRLSKSNNVEDLEQLSYGLDAILAMYETTDSLNYLNDAITLVNNNLKQARITKKIPQNKYILRDKYKGWIQNGKDSTSGVFHKEVVLDEIYFYQYVCRLLKDIKTNKSLRRQQPYKKFSRQTFNFIETNIWDKWISRGLRYKKNPYHFLMLVRTHMASHWAYIAAELYFLTRDSKRKIAYLNFVNFYNNQLEKNFHKYENYISWNQTWDDSPSDRIIQDVSHANLVVSYLVEAYDLGLWTDFDAIQRIIITLKDKLWDSNDCIFKDNIDGTMIPASQVHRSIGSFQTDGFVKLTRYDGSLFPIYEKFMECSKYLAAASYQYGQLFANLALSEKLLSGYSKK
jgi:hypothetical protein